MTSEQANDRPVGSSRPDRSIADEIERLSSKRRVPCTTYRCQFNADFTLDHAAELVDYLHDLGVTHVYASPLFTARAGSTHGYDVCDPTRIGLAVGGQEALDRLSARLAEHDMGLLLDIVPNHMGINDVCNAWWFDVLENGPSSLYSAFFDVDWAPSKPELQGRVLLPLLEDQYGAVLEAGKLKLAFLDGAFHIEYYDNRFPIAPDTYGPILQEWLGRVRAAPEPSADDEAAALELESVITAVGYLPGRSETDDQRRHERAREKEIIKRRLAAVRQSGATAFNALQETLALFNGDPEDVHSFDRLDALLENQVHRLAYWRVAGEEINYRRFFDIRDLAAIRVEEPQVFEATHALALRLLAEGKIAGLRIDHPDGLFHPTAYFRRLQAGYLRAVLGQGAGGDGEAVRAQVEAWLDAQIARAGRGKGHAPWPLYVVAEKILSDTEPLPLDWAVDGTTGYDFLASANAVQVNTAAETDFTHLYADFSGEDPDFDALTVRTQRLIMREALASEINELSHQLERVAERNRHTRDFTLNNLRDAVRSLVTSLPVYRTYIDPATGVVSGRDRRYIVEAVQLGQALASHVDASYFEFLRATLLLENHAQFCEEDRPALAHWVMKFQQMTGPVMAKGVEDTAFYRYNRLVSLNEVGAHPTVFGIDVAQFHKDNARRARHWPQSMLTTSTHDNKRSEDVRARLNVLSELPEAWSQGLAKWSILNLAHKTRRDGNLLPDRNDEYLLYQIVLGAWPLAEAPQAGSPWGALLPPGDSPEYQGFVERIGQYMYKAVKEAKVHGSWINPAAAYDEAMQGFVKTILRPAAQGEPNRFFAAFAPLAARVAFLGQVNSVSQVALKLTSPGMPDIYQGNELWDFSLVDPDNRRRVDYARRQELLASLPQGEMAQAQLQDLLTHSHDGRIKLFVTTRLLCTRRDHRRLFQTANYTPLEVRGSRADHVIAFARREGHEALIAVAPRLHAALVGDELCWPLGEVWGDTEIVLPAEFANSPMTDALTGRRQDGAPTLRVAELLAALPVAVLISI